MRLVAASASLLPFASFVSFALLAAPAQAQSEPLPALPAPPVAQAAPAASPAPKPVAAPARPVEAAPQDSPAASSEGDEEAHGARFSMGARAGVMFPMGSLAANVDLSTIANNGIPLIVDLGARVSPKVYVGGSFQYAIVSAAGCNSSASCSANDIRFGADLEYHFQPYASFDPWIGFGVGYEWLNYSGTAGTNSASIQFKGIDFLDLQLGGDWVASKSGAIGPYIGLAVGQYGSGTVTANGQSADGSINQTALHEWLTLGLRGTFMP